MVTSAVGNVYEDPRGKVTRDGQLECVFVVRNGDSIQHMRYRNREDAERARAELLEES